MAIKTKQSLYPLELRAAILAKYPYKSPAAIQTIFDTALHEAAHIVMGVRLCAFVDDATISPQTYSHRLGHAGVIGVTYEDEYMICFAGVLVELARNIDSAVDDIDFGSDGNRVKEFIEWYLEAYGRTKTEYLLNGTLATLVWCWRAIEGVAALLIQLGNRSGYVTRRKMKRIVAWIESGEWHYLPVRYPLPHQYRLASRADNARVFGITADEWQTIADSGELLPPVHCRALRAPTWMPLPPLSWGTL
jgi:hypothetical protein